MTTHSCRILSLAPYRVLPPTTGGHWGIVSMHDALGRICPDHVLGTTDNGDDTDYSFILHRIFPSRVRRYIPMQHLRTAAGIARKHGATHIFCDHPYMAPLAITLSRRLRIPWVLRSHNIETVRFRHMGKPWWPIFRLFERHAMRSAKAVFFITPEDRMYAMNDHGLHPNRCLLAPYGTPLNAQPEGHEKAKTALAAQLSLNPALPWLYFLGVHSYAPNADAVAYILHEVYPRLQAAGIRCEIIIGGKGLPQPLQAEIAQTKGAIRYAGFIEALDPFIRACDVMLNPILTGGGIKTKAVEALAYNKIVISTVNGAAGILPEVCGNNLLLSADGNWDSFAANVSRALQTVPDIPSAFYERYNWDAIARYVVENLEALRYGRGEQVP